MRTNPSFSCPVLPRQHSAPDDDDGAPERPVDDGVNDLLEADDLVGFESAGSASHAFSSRPKNDWKGALIGSALLHVSLIVAGMFIVAKLNVVVQWHAQRGDPHAEGGPAAAAQSAESGEVAQQTIAPPPIAMSVAQRDQTSATVSLDDSSALPDQLTLLPLSVTDAVIGVGANAGLQPSPHFASTQPHAAGQSTAARADPTPAAQKISPPRLASEAGGQRGERDGFDSRGLPIPDYPAESRRRGEEGVVVVDVEVLTDGHAGVIRVVSDAGFPRLGTAAAEKLKLASFEPARAEGKPVVGHILIPYRFTLQ